MSDPRKALEQKFNDRNRYSNFGPILRSIDIQGFRGVFKKISFNHPITAFSGLNGCGKSTIGQIAVCGYKKPSTSSNYRRYYINDFFPYSVADPNPFGPDSKVVYEYATSTPLESKTLTISRATSEWSGYKRQPERFCYYIGIAAYLPKVERRDFSVYLSRDISLGDKRVLDEEVKSKVKIILNQDYSDLFYQQILHKNKDAQLGMASKGSDTYSENNMGFGEGRIFYLVNLLENSPSQSLFVIEEPETSLHEDAQHEFTKYLLEICGRRNHQIVFSTHSSTILNALPPESRQFIYRKGNEIELYESISSTRARSILSRGHFRSLNICVEDEFAKYLLTEIIRKENQALLKTIMIESVGDTKAVLSAVRLLQKISVNVIAIRDGDIGDDRANSVYSLPGSLPPEKEVYLNPNVKGAIKCKYGIEIDAMLSLHPDLDHHDYTDLFSNEAETDAASFRSFAIDCYLSELKKEDYLDLVSVITERC
ncbi:ATP-dependent nuclease [Desulfolutivibrio sulfoxidireducens]|uniref:ATP-dependent nuclease n=1 Tax=Desulfolutivibrio sulfoxidireducens TaxID=2773299 RepID=UPI00159EB4B5|nr:AAA family ATPase [Desulfolutivibrio sulfoxidireducens]QLA19398.1 AAA family ATPase [Desulfolutivibrio sulfoxidireducens]